MFPSVSALAPNGSFITAQKKSTVELNVQIAEAVNDEGWTDTLARLVVSRTDFRWGVVLILFLFILRDTVRQKRREYWLDSHGYSH